MKLRVKAFKIGAGKPIVFVHESDASKLNVHVGDRVQLSRDHTEVIAVVDIVGSYFKKGEIGVSEKIFDALHLRSGDLVELTLIPLPSSTRLIQKKMSCIPYTQQEIYSIIKDIVTNKLTEAEIAYFVSGVYHCGMSPSETIALVKAICDTGIKLTWHTHKIADKHSIGGIPGNRTTPIVVSICASAGIVMPKTSSRAITSAAGTADVVETVAKVDFPASKLKKIVEKTGACLAWGGSLGLAPADDKLIQVERLLNIDPEPQLIASIMAKKIAVGSKYILIDIPYGKGAKVSREKALSLKKRFMFVAKNFGLTLKVALTNGNEPIGNGIGPTLEMKDILRVLQRNNSPKDLEKKSIYLASIILEMMGKAKKGKGKILAKKLLDSGEAFRKFEEIITAQDGSLHNLKDAEFVHAIHSSKSGRIKSIDNKSINYLARVAGCPADKHSGLYLHKHVGDKVKKGEVILEIHTESKHKITEALDFFETARPIQLN